MKAVNTTKAPAAVGPYSQGMISGNTVFCSGQIPIVPETGDIIMGDITAATTQCLKNLSAVLEEAGSSLDKIVPPINAGIANSSESLIIPSMTFFSFSCDST